ncbi:hypothetical protein [Halosimplex pelagicum]|uniref:Uncharacterized protein n=1 Tax=Halosimplex pelagicum TaxID=869886 RepID=A0A7D5P7C4_9EURY|nr:hypothetical protein [Halosimplex pelagicum]QLH81001.1 hypothetical protein HZS54_04835 [Halosimplex pelagicum]
MVIFDRRDEFADSESNLETVAAEAHDLYSSDAFKDDVAEALGPVVKQHLDCEAVDAAAEEVLREWMAKEAMGGLFQLRNQIVTNRQADFAEGDLIRMQSASDPDEIIRYVIDDAAPDDTGVRVYRVPDDPDDDPSMTDHSAGHIKFCDRFAVDRSYRDAEARPFVVARRLGNGQGVDLDE